MACAMICPLWYLQMFEEHGDFKLCRINNVVVVKPYGDWNLPVVERLITESELLFQTLKGTQWAALDMLNDWGLGTPETDEIIKYMEVHAQSFGLSHVAVLYKSEVQAFQLEEKIIHHPEVSRFQSRSVEECISFLNTAGYDITIGDIESLNL